MLSAAMAREPFDPSRRGNHAAYRDNEINHCPGCGRTHWYIGRVTAECAFCATSLPLASSLSQGHGPVVIGLPKRRPPR